MAAGRLGLQHIEAFRAVMMTGSMTASAKRLHTSQPQISRLIGQLERITQFRLFDRNGSRLSPTLEGSRFFQDVERSFVSLTNLETAVANIRSFSGGHLSVAAMPRLAGGLLTRIVASFKADYPDVMVSIHSGTATAVHNWVSSGLCDAGLAMLYNDASGIEVEAVLQTSCVAVLPKNHRLAVAEHLRPEDFRGEHFISFSSGGQLRDRIDQLFQAAGVERKIVAETDLGASVCALVAAGLGVSLINPLAAEEESRMSGIVVKPFSPALPVTMALVYPPFKRRSKLVEAFERYAKVQIKDELSEISQSRSALTLSTR